MRTLLVIVLIALFSSNLFAQDASFPKTESKPQDTIKTFRNFWGTTFHLGWRELKMKELHNIVRENPEANIHLKNARVYNTFAGIFGFAGGFAIGLAIGPLVLGGEISPEMLLIGGGLTVVSIPFSISAGVASRRAVNIYNRDILHPETSSVQPTIHLGFTGNGIGLALRF